VDVVADIFVLEDLRSIKLMGVSVLEADPVLDCRVGSGVFSGEGVIDIEGVPSYISRSEPVLGEVACRLSLAYTLSVSEVLLSMDRIL
jgi:hypothetical protein